MNQILSMNQQNPDFGSNYNNNAGGGGGKTPLDIKIVKRIFGGLLIVFGIALFIGGVIGLLGKAKPAILTGDWPTITTTQYDNILTIVMNSDTVIANAEYSWNGGTSTIIDGNGTTDLIEDISIPVGENSLNIMVIDIDGKTKTYQDTYTGVAEEDTTPAEITLSVQKSKLVITVNSTTSTRLAYLTYKWDNGEEVRVDAINDQMQIEATADVSEGAHTITVVAVKENGVEATEQKEIIGYKKPSVSAVVDSTGNYLVVTMTDDVAIISADITFNGKSIVLTPDRFGVPVVEFKLPMVQGENTILVTARNENAEVVYNGRASK